MNNDLAFYQDLSYRNDLTYVAEQITAHLSRREVVGKDVLDFGCGSGDAAFHVVQHLGARTVTGIDLGHFNILEARRRRRELGITNADFKQGDLDHTDIGEGMYDLIWSDTMVEYLRSPLDDVGRRFYRALRPGGRLVISFLPKVLVNRCVYEVLVPALRSLMPAWSRFMIAHAIRSMYPFRRWGDGQAPDLKNLQAKVSYMFVPYVRLTRGSAMCTSLVRGGFRLQYLRPRAKSDPLTTPHLVIKAIKPAGQNPRGTIREL